MARLHEFKPDFILISAGFDGHKNEEIICYYCWLTEHDYLIITYEIIEVFKLYCNGWVVSVQYEVIYKNNFFF